MDGEGDRGADKGERLPVGLRRFEGLRVEPQICELVERAMDVMFSGIRDAISDASGRRCLAGVVVVAGPLQRRADLRSARWLACRWTWGWRWR